MAIVTAERVKPRARRHFPVFPSLAMVRRELLVSLRSRGLTVCLLIFVVTLILFVAALWPAREVATIGSPSENARTIYMALSYVLMAGASLLMPGLAAGSITAERDADTYDQLHLTLIRPAGLVMAKFANTVGVYLLFCAASLPVLATVMFLVGLETHQLLTAAVVILITAATCGLLGLAAGAWTRNTLRATLLAYFLTLCYMGLPHLLLVALMGAAGMLSRTSGSQFVEWLLLHLTSLGALFSAISGRWQPAAYVPLVLYSTVIGTVALAAAYVRLRRPLVADEAGRSEPAQPDAGSIPYRYGRDNAVVAFPDRVNPIPTRELRCTTRRRGFYDGVLARVITFAAGNLVLMVWGATMRMGPDSVIGLSLTLQMILVAFIGPAFGASLLTREFEQGNIDFLRTTLLRDREVVWGKARAAYESFAPWLSSLLVGCFPLALILDNNRAIATLILGVGCLVASAVTVVSLSVLASACTRRTGTAIVIAYTFTILLYGGLSLGLAGLLEYLRLTSLNVNGLVAFPSPPMAFIEACRLYYMESGFLHGNGFSLVPVSRDPWGFWWTHLLGQGLISFFSINLATRLYARRKATP